MSLRLKPFRFFFVFLAIFLIANTNGVLQAQSTSEYFGKNRIQTKRFDWTYYKTENFEIYFYREGSEIARFTALHAEEEYKRISNMIGYAPFGKTRLLLYNSHSDLLQSNIGLDDELAFIGGQTNFVKLNAEIAFNGNLIDFKNDINTSIARIYITDLLYGGNIREIYQNSLLMNLPDWFVPGAAAYVGCGWSQEMDDFMRDAVFKYRLRNPSKFRGQEAEWLGQSIFNFVAEEYGLSQMENIIIHGRIMRNDREAIENTLDISYRDFMKKWRSYYKEMAIATSNDYAAPDKKTRIKKHNHRNVDFYKIKISPNGLHIAYTQNKKGRYAVKLLKVKQDTIQAKKQKTTEEETLKISDIDRELGLIEDTNITRLADTLNVPIETEIKFGRRKTIRRGGTNLVNQKVNYNTPLMTWKNNNHLAIMVKKKNRHILKTYNVRGRLKSRINIYNFNQILDFNYSPDDNFIVLSAERNGQSDIYEYDTRRAKTRVITNDMYDDLNPIYQKGTKNLIWSSNRHNDTLGVDAGRFRLLGTNMDLFRFEPEKSATILTRLTQTPDDETKPIMYDPNTLLYLSDQTGILNANKIDLNDSLFTMNQISSNLQNFKDYDINAKNKGIAYVTFHRGKERVHFEPLDIEKTVTPIKIFRKNHIEQQELLSEKKIEDNRTEAVRIVEEKIRTENESKKLEALVDAIMNGTLSDSVIAKMTEDTTVNVVDLDTLQTETFIFESEKNTLKATEAAYIKSIGIKTDQYYLYKSDFQVFASKGGLWKARHRLGLENTVTSIVFDPLRGFGTVMNATLTDMHNDHRFYGGMFADIDFRTSNVYLEYQYLKKRIDFKFRYEKQRLYIRTEESYWPTRYTLNRWETEISLPLSNVFRLSLIPSYMNSRFTISVPLNTTATGTPDYYDRFTHYASYRAEAVYDNALITGHNLQEGSKFKLLYEYHYAFESTEKKIDQVSKMNFGRIGLDVRRYQRLHQELLLATRFSGGTFLGNSKKNFLLGGMDNWAGGNATNTTDPSSPLYNEELMDKRDLLFNKYATNMRGFSYNKLYGNNFVLFNAEIRWPIVKYFYRGVVSSNFLKNIQLTTFYDVGTAWSGAAPWKQDNNFNSLFVAKEGSSFSANVINYRNAWLQAFGPGVRTTLMGYYMKVDVAWGILDYVIQKPMWHVTLGYDF